MSHKLVNGVGYVAGDITGDYKEANSIALDAAIDVSTLSGSATFETPDLKNQKMGSLQINLASMVGGETINVYFANVSGANAGTAKATITVSAGASKELVEFNNLTSRFIRVEFTGLTTGSIEGVFFIAKK